MFNDGTVPNPLHQQQRPSSHLIHCLPSILHLSIPPALFLSRFSSLSISIWLPTGSVTSNHIKSFPAQPQMLDVLLLNPLKSVDQWVKINIAILSETSYCLTQFNVNLSHFRNVTVFLQRKTRQCLRIFFFYNPEYSSNQ